MNGSHCTSSCGIRVSQVLTSNLPELGAHAPSRGRSLSGRTSRKKRTQPPSRLFMATDEGDRQEIAEAAVASNHLSEFSLLAGPPHEALNPGPRGRVQWPGDLLGYRPEGDNPASWRRLKHFLPAG
jgi:hypothetical protein